MANPSCLTFALDGREDEHGGVMKTVLRAAPEDAEAPSKENYVCVVHYVGSLEDGTVFDSSREEDTPFTVEIGKNRVIKAWEVALPTMKVGELCKLVCESSYAYGDEGSPPDIPPKATLVFETELMSVRATLKGGPVAELTKKEERKRLDERKLEREMAVAAEPISQEGRTSDQRRADAKAAAAARFANKGQKKGGGKKK